MGFAGGIIGECQNSSSQNSTILNNVYNVGTVTCDTSLVGRIGGLIGAVEGNVTISNSYNAGTVSGGSPYGTYSGAIVGSLAVGLVLNSSNLYYLDSSSSKDCGSSTITGVTPKTDAELKDSGMPGLLNASQNPAPWYRKDGVNNGWPILRMGVAVPELKLTPTSLSIVWGNAATFTYEYTGNGEISVVSLSTTVCTVSNNASTKTVTVTSANVGNTTVKVSAKETESYAAVEAIVTVAVTRKPIARPTASNKVYNRVAQSGVPTGEGYTLGEQTSGTNVGSYTTSVTLDGNHKWSTGSELEVLSLSWTIYPKEITASMITLSYATATYTGKGLEPGVTVMDGVAKLGSPKEYTVTYTSNTDVGTATVTVKGVGNYTGSPTAQFTITRKTIDLPIARNDLVYNRASQTGVPAGEGYTVTANTGTNAGSYTAKVTPDKNHQWNTTSNQTGEQQISWNIARKPISDNDVTKSISTDAKEYNGNAQVQNVSLTYLNIALVNGTEYNVTYENNISVGLATVKVTGVGNYSGEISKTFSIISKTVTGLTLQPLASNVYDRKPKTPAPIVKNGETILSTNDYEVTYANNINAGTATVTVSGKGNYSGSTSATFEIKPKPITDDDVTKNIGTETKTYNGSAQTQSISLAYIGEALVINTEYDIKYENNKDAGTAKITITGKDNYMGSIEKTFTINRANQTVTLYNPNNTPVSIGTATVTGVNNTALSPDITYLYYTNKECTDRTKTTDGAQAEGQAPAYAGTYYVVASAAESKNYNAGSKTVTLVINKIENTLSVTANPNLRNQEAPQNLVITTNAQGDVYYLVGDTMLTANNYTIGSTITPQQAAGGTYVVQYYTPGNRNYKEKGGNVTVGIISTYYKDNATPVGYFVTLSEAYANTKGTQITLMSNAEESTVATLQAGKTIVLNLNNKSISSKASSDFIVNNGALTITGNGSIVATVAGAIKNVGTLNVNNSTITGSKNGITQTSGSTSIVSGSIIGNSGSGINATGGKVVIGTSGGSVTTTPSIQGSTYGIEISGATFEFYDGTLKGKTEAFKGVTTKLEVNYIIAYGSEVINGESYKTAYLISKIAGTAIITEWRVPAKAQIKIPIPANANNKYQVDWGDGQSEAVVGIVGFAGHSYSNTSEQVYTITVTGTVDSFGYYESAVPTESNIYKDYYTFTQYLIGFKNWGETGATRYGFSQCTNLAGAIPTPNDNSFKNVTNVSYLFNNCKNLSGTIPATLFRNDLDIRNTARAFRGCTGLTEGEVNINTDNITSMDEMFYGCSNMRTIVFGTEFKKLIGKNMYTGCDKLEAVVMMYKYSG